MAHLIQPIDISAVKYCPTCQTGHATRAVLTDDHLFLATNAADVTTPCGGWDMIEGSIAWEGEVSFGVTCCSEVTVEFSANGAPDSETEGHYVECHAYLDGTFVDFVYLYVGGTDSIAIPITSEACGSIITLHCYDSVAVGIDINATATIISIT